MLYVFAKDIFLHYYLSGCLQNTIYILVFSVHYLKLILYHFIKNVEALAMYRSTDTCLFCYKLPYEINHNLHTHYFCFKQSYIF